MDEMAALDRLDHEERRENRDFKGPKDHQEQWLISRAS